MPTRLSAGPLQVTSLDLTSVNYMLQQVRRELDEIKGLRGEVTIHSNVSITGTLVLTGTPNTVFAFDSDGTSTYLEETGTGKAVLDTSPAIVTPTILSFVNANHGHSSAGSGGLVAHTYLTGLSNDEHAQYLLASSATSRAFFAASWTDLTDGGASTLHSHAAGAVDHGALTGLADDDHTQYLLASAATDRATFAANWTDLTDAGATTLHSHAGGLTGSGTAGRVAFWDGATSLSSDADLTFSGSTLTATNLTLAATTSTAGQVKSGSDLLMHTYGTASTFLGVGAGNLTHTVGYNTGVGTGVLAALTEGFFNVAMGRLALSSLTSGDRNTGIGTNALILLTTGDKNVAIGSDSLGSLVSGSSFIAIGESSMTNAVSGTDNVGIGENAMDGLTTGSYNTAVGALSMQSGAMVGALANTGCGRNSLGVLAAANFNSALGYNSLSGVTTGGSNTGVGDRAGVVITTGSNNTFLGALADSSGATLTNAGAIGANAIVGSSNHIMLGDSAVCIGIAGAARPTGSGGLIFPDGTILSSMASNTAGLYANDVGGTVTMFSMNEAGLASQHGPWGVYTPTLTNVANLAASTAYSCQYVRFGNIVTVSGKVDIDPTTTLTATQLGISLPIASDLGAAEDCAGTAFASGIASQGAAILGDATNNRAEMNWLATDVTNQPMYFTFTYEVI